MELLERDRPLEALEAWLSEARTGTGSLVLLAGEAGIGKTALAHAFCTRHERDAYLWWGGCDALSTPRPLGPLYDIARAAGGELAALMAGEVSRYERFSGFLAALVSPLRPVIAVIEDAHWADDATRDLLVFTARRVIGTHGVVVVTYRDDDLAADHPLRSVLGQLATVAAVHRVTLARLSEAGVAALAAGRGADPARLYQVTGGNPFFVTEALAVGPGTVPATVRDAVLARAARLSGPARSVLDAAAVVPDRAELALVCSVSGSDLDAVDECEQAGLLQPAGGSVRFRHELARLAVEQAIGSGRRLNLHARVLDYLTGQSDADPTRLAYHAQLAGDRDAVLRYAPAAAERAGRLGSHRQAIAHYRSALRHAGSLPDVERAELLERYAWECRSVDRYADAVDAAQEAIEIWQAAGAVDRMGRLLALQGGYLWTVARAEEAYQAAHRAVSLLEPHGDSPALAVALAELSALHMLRRRVHDAVEVGNRAAKLAERFGEARALARALNAVGSALWFTSPGQAEAPLLKSLEVARRAGDDTGMAVAMTNLGSGAGEVRRYAVADRWLREAIEWTAERDLDANHAYGMAWQARTHFEQGRWSEAATAATAAASSTGVISRIVALTVLGRLRVRRGDPDPDGPLAEAWRLAVQTGDVQRLWPAAAGRAEAAWLAGQPERIPALVEDTFQLALRLDQEWPIGELGFWLWRAGNLASVPGRPARPYAEQIRGHWRAAASSWVAIGCPYEVALALIDSEHSEDLLRALEILGGLGARPLADLVAARLRGLGVRRLPRRPTRATLANPARLTDRELEVLALLASGNSNAEIAAALHISPKTAGHHVSAILAKLEVPSRRDAARAAAELGITG